MIFRIPITRLCDRSARIPMDYGCGINSPIFAANYFALPIYYVGIIYLYPANIILILVPMLVLL